VPPVDDDAARGRPAVTSAIGASAAGEAGLSGNEMGVASSPGTPGLELVPAAGSPSAAHVQFHTQFQPARGALVGAVRHAPVQFHTQVQVSGAPGALAPLGEALAAGALAPSLVAVAAGVRAPAAVTVTPPGAIAPLGEAARPRACAPPSAALATRVAASPSDAVTPGAVAASSETLAAGVEAAWRAGAAGSSCEGPWSVVAAAGVAAAS
jgi:hypothetical protein